MSQTPVTSGHPIRPASEADRPAVHTLLLDCRLPIEGLRPGLPDVWIAGAAGEVCGVIGLEQYGSVGLLRSAAVRADRRGGGLGDRLVRHVLAVAEQRGLHAVYLLTTTAELYFPRFGFVPVPRSELPQELGASVELRGACPASAVAMGLLIAGPAAPPAAQGTA